MLSKDTECAYKRDNVNALTQIPANNVNFTAALREYATNGEIRRAIEIMEVNPQGNKTRLAACERELKRRERA
jgi:hypothetical protein